MTRRVKVGNIYVGGGAPVTVDDLKCGKHFKMLEWVGFMTNGASPAVWHLDDFIVEPVK